MKRPRFLFDVESASPLNLSVVGAARYWEDPETRIICLYHRIDDGPLHRWRPGDPAPVFDPSSRFVAHNYLFEYPCWQHKLGPLFGWGEAPPLSQWDCTMARALYWGLPAALGDACDALNLPVTKDKGARPLMLRMMRPRRGAGDKYTWWHETDGDKLARLEAYCGQDVLAECALDDALPELPEFEREIFEIDGEINLRGVAIDPKLIELLISYTEEETDRLDAEMRTLTEGRVKSTNQVGALKLELENRGAVLPDLMRETVFHAVTDPGTPPAARELLLRRQEAAKTSTAKLLKMRGGMSPEDQRCRGLLQYGGAGRTMRWAGRRVQPQNFPRGTVKNIASVYPLIESSIPRDDLDMLLPGSIMDMAASALRGCFVASPGHVLVSGDLAQIEARVLAWLAGQEDVLDVFRSGQDIYTYMANRVGSDNRQFGKVLVLACGFGMGPGKFQDTAKTYGVDLTAWEAEDAVSNWRAVNPRSVQFWWDVDRAFKDCTSGSPGTERKVGQFITIRKTKQAVRIVLPSTHEITYQFAQIEPNPQYPGRPDVTFMGVDQKTHKWSRQRTYGGKLVENIVQATARDVLGVAMKRVRARGAPIVLTVHDELLTEAPEHSAREHLTALLADMTTPPAWAPGLPVAAEGWVGERYRK